MANTISNKALKLKLNPSQKQYSQFLQSFGCERFIYNFYLAEKNNFYEKEIKPLGNDKKQEMLSGDYLKKLHLQRWTCPQCGNEHQRDENAALNIKAEAIRVLREPEERKEKPSSKKKMSKDTSSVLSTSELANLALSLSSGIGNARNKSTHAEVV